MAATEFELNFWALRYKRAYEHLLSKETKNSRQIIQDPNKRESTVSRQFAKKVIALAESEDRIEDAPTKNE